jgi:hypothetical protein
MPKQRCIGPGSVPSRQRRARLEAFQFDSRAGTGAQQSVGRFAQFGPRFGRIVIEGRVEGRQECGNVGVDSLTQGAIDESPTLLHALPVARCTMRHRIAGRGNG